MTVSLRFDAARNMGATEFQTALGPYLRIHFLFRRNASSPKRRRRTRNICQWRDHHVCPFSCFHVVKCVHGHGNTWRGCLQYRGDVVPQVVSTAMVLGRDLPFCPVPCACAPCFLLACTVVITRENIMFATSKRVRHERGNPRKMPDVRLMTFKRDLG